MTKKGMGAFMRGFFKNIKGAVTVFITLLLIPAVLISGTAVDLARIHTARSILQDGNQLAANSVLTQYDALLHDLYGMFGLMADDPVLASMIDEYIEVAVFGEDWNEKGVGTLQLFYGSKLQSAEFAPAPEKNLRNADVLRRQIEEYMKFRAPVIIVKEFLDAIGDNKLKDDKEVVEKKLQIDSDIAEMYELYKRLYDAIVTADKCNQAIGGIAGGSFGSLSSTLTLIRQQFVDLRVCASKWQALDGSTDPDDLDDLTDTISKYTAILGNIRSYTIGGPRGSNWTAGSWGAVGNVKGLNAIMADAKAQGENFKPKFDEVVTIAREIDEKHDDLKKKIDDLEDKLKRKECSEDLQKALTERGSDGKSQIECYRELLQWDKIAEMASAFKTGGYSYIDDIFKPMLDEVRYRNSASPSGRSLSRDELANLEAVSGLGSSETATVAYGTSSYFASFPDDSVTYKMPP
ncbi:MAG: Tad domain-containing protein, partial [Oscillospiraceae bacterium]|nr:Tad domain-containing protein [Oscillospiraceae bacterium]